MKNVTIPHLRGINNIDYVLLDDYTIRCISDYELGPEQFRLIEGLLGIDLRLGKRFIPEAFKDKFGKYVTIWSFLSSGDCDWS